MKKLEPYQILEHLQHNYNVANYCIPHSIMSYDNKKIIFDIQKLFKIESTIQLIQKNFEIAEKTMEVRNIHKKPLCGDFFKIKNDVFRISSICHSDSKFQYSNDGSFYLDNLSSTFSGAFNFEHGGRLKIENLKLTQEVKIGRFWFFSNNDVRAHNGVNFFMEFKVWEYQII